MAGELTEKDIALLPSSARDRIREARGDVAFPREEYRKVRGEVAQAELLCSRLAELLPTLAEKREIEECEWLIKNRGHELRNARTRLAEFEGHYETQAIRRDIMARAIAMTPKEEITSETNTA